MERNVKDLLPENVLPYIVLVRKFIPKGWQLSCHLITGSNVKDLSLQNT